MTTKSVSCCPARSPFLYDLASNFFDNQQECDVLLKLASRYGVSDPRRVLDLGCGPGTQLREFARRGISAWGIDNDVWMLHYARGLAKQDRLKVTLKAGDMRRVHLRGQFDLVLCLGATFNSMASTADAQAVLRSIAPILRPKGLFQIELHYPPWVFSDNLSSRWTVTYDFADVACRFTMRRPVAPVATFQCLIVIDARFQNGQPSERAIFENPARPWFRSQLEQLAESSGTFKLVGWHLSKRSGRAPRIFAIFRRR